MASKSSSFLSFLVLILFFVIFSPMAVGEFINVRLKSAEENIVFYVHETASGPNATLITVAGVNGTSSDLSGFGTIFVIDNLVTQGSDNSSTTLGRLKGLEANSNSSGPNYFAVSSLIFEDGSTLQIHGLIRNPLSQRELAVVGGTGRFRYALGYVLVETVYFNGVNLTFKFNVTIQSQSGIFKALHSYL